MGPEAGRDASTSCGKVVELLAHRAHRGYLFDAAIQEFIDIGIPRY
jgi:hypothetical protein